MTPETTIDSETPERETVSFWKQVRRGALLLLSAMAIYLLLTGPLLWSYSKIQNPGWQNFVYYAVSPILKLDSYEQREYRAVLRGKLTPVTTRRG